MWSGAAQSVDLAAPVLNDAPAHGVGNALVLANVRHLIEPVFLVLDDLVPDTLINVLLVLVDYDTRVTPAVFGLRGVVFGLGLLCGPLLLCGFGLCWLALRRGLLCFALLLHELPAQALPLHQLGLVLVQCLVCEFNTHPSRYSHFYSTPLECLIALEVKRLAVFLHGQP